jgi:hypothetical protein
MTGTICVYTSRLQSRSYLNHLVCVFMNVCIVVHKISCLSFHFIILRMGIKKFKLLKHYNLVFHMAPMFNTQIVLARS